MDTTLMILIGIFCVIFGCLLGGGIFCLTDSIERRKEEVAALRKEIKELKEKKEE